MGGNVMHLLYVCTFGIYAFGFSSILNYLRVSLWAMLGTFVLFLCLALSRILRRKTMLKEELRYCFMSAETCACYLACGFCWPFTFLVPIIVSLGSIPAPPGYLE
jgi:hypothetical protein